MLTNIIYITACKLDCVTLRFDLQCGGDCVQPKLRETRKDIKELRSGDGFYFWSGGAAYFEPKLLLKVRRKADCNIKAIG